MRGLYKVLIASGAIAAAGCSDGATAPGIDRDLAPSARPSLNYGYNPSPTPSGFRSTTFRLTSSGGKFSIGDVYKLSVPSDAVCDERSSWDRGCDLLRSGESVTITATYGYRGGTPVVEFAPDLRFASNRVVTLSTSIYSNILTSNIRYFLDHEKALRGFSIFFTDDLGDTETIDAARDSTVITHVNLRLGIVWRRVKHFSGYSVATGRACDF